MSGSFKEAKKAVADNIKALSEKLSYSPTTLVLKLGTLCSSSKVSAQDAIDWMNGVKLPSVYHLYKLSQLFNIGLTDLFDPNFNIDEANVKGFAKQQQLVKPNKANISGTVLTSTAFGTPLFPSATSGASSTCFTNEALITTTHHDSLSGGSMNNKKAVSISTKRFNTLATMAMNRTDARHPNLLLVGKLYGSKIDLKVIANDTGISTRSLRDYAFYGVSIPEDRVNALCAYFETNVRGLGLTRLENGRYGQLAVKRK